MPPERKRDFQETPISNEDEDENSRNTPVPPPAVTPISEGFPSNLPPQSITSTGPIHNQDQDGYNFTEITENDIQLLRDFFGEGSGSSSEQPAPAAQSPPIIDPDDDFLESILGNLPPRPSFSTNFYNREFPDIKYFETSPAETATDQPPATDPVEPLPFRILVKIWPHFSVKQLTVLVMMGTRHTDITEMVLEMVDTIPSLRTMYVKCRLLPLTLSLLRNTLNRYGDIEGVQLLDTPWDVVATWYMVMFKKTQSLVKALQSPVTNICGSPVGCCQIEMPNTSLGVIDKNLLSKLSLEQLQNLASIAAWNHSEVMTLVYKLAETLPVLCTLRMYGLEKDLDIDSIVNAMSIYGDIVESHETAASYFSRELCTIRFRKRKSLLEAMKKPRKNIGGKVVYCTPKSF